MAISHANCTHPRTPAGRRACRAAVANGTTLDMTPERSAEVDRQVKAFSDAFDTAKAAATRRAHIKGLQNRLESMADGEHPVHDEIRMTGATARKLARHAVKAETKRIQPRRSGARVSPSSSSCVQAALHIDAHGGRCACGWAAEKVA